MVRILTVFGVAALLLRLPLAAQQDQGVIAGTVTDGSAAVIPGASVTIRETGTNVTKMVRTNGDGVYVSGPLRIGVYELSVETTGFKRAVRSGVEIHPGDRIGVNFALELGDVVEVVEASGATPLLETESASLAYTVERRQIEDLPISGRNYQSLALLTAGVAPEIGGRDRGPLGDAAIGGGFVSHGQSALQNNFLIDGVDNNSTIMGLQDRKAQAIIPSMDAVQEFKVQTSNYSAEYGRNAGAVVNVTIRGGTNQLHGSLYEFVRSDAFDAREAFGRQDLDGDGKADPEILRQNQFGATLGGPIVKDTAFFFASWEGWRLRKAQSDLVIIPSLLEREGDFSQTTALSSLRDPAGGTFPNLTIPRNRFDPVFARLVELYPDPNYADNTRNNYSNGPPWTTDRDQYDFRYDHTFSANDSAFVRYSHFRFDNLRGAPLPGIARGGVGNDRALDDNDGDHLTASYTKVFAPTVINEFRFGLKHLKVDKNQPLNEVQDDLNRQFGIKGVPRVETLYGLPRIQLAGGLGMTGLGGSNNLPNNKVSDTWQFVDNLTFIRGNHSFKAGVDIRHDLSDILGAQSATGTFQFNGRYTGIGLGDAFLGWINQATLGTTIDSDMRFDSWMGYFQDDWKVTPKLTLNLGLRYELTTPWIEARDRMNRVVFDPGPDFGSIQQAGEQGGGHASRGLVNIDRNNWAPRVGFAWQPGAHWTVRASSGVFYGGQEALGADARMVRNFPFVAIVVGRGNNRQPAFLLSDGFPAGFLGDLNAPVNTVADLPADSVVRNWSTDFPATQVYQWNFSVQRQLASDLAVTAAYVGSSTTGIMYEYNINGPGRGDPNTEAQRRVYFPSLNALSYRSPAAHASYHGLDLMLTKRFSHGLSFTTAYTWSRGMGETAEQFVEGDEVTAQDIYCLACERGPNSNDVRQRFVTSYMLELPFGRGRALLDRGGVLSAILGGWQMTGIVSAQTGQYYDVTLANGASQLGTNAAGVWRPDVVGDHRVSTPDPDGWFNPAAFATPIDAAGNFNYGNLGRNALQEPGLFNIDLGLMKNFQVSERFRLQFRWEVFNVTNHPSYGTPETDISNPDAGIIRSTLGLARQMQFGVRLSW